MKLGLVTHLIRSYHLPTMDAPNPNQDDGNRTPVIHSYARIRTLNLSQTNSQTRETRSPSYLSSQASSISRSPFSSQASLLSRESRHSSPFSEASQLSRGSPSPFSSRAGSPSDFLELERTPTLNTYATPNNEVLPMSPLLIDMTPRVPSPVQPMLIDPEPPIHTSFSTQNVILPARVLTRISEGMVTANKDLNLLREEVRNLRPECVHPSASTSNTRPLENDDEDADDENIFMDLPSDLKSKIQEEVREHARLLMKRFKSNDIFDEALLPTEHEIERFDPNFGEACSAESFRPDLRKEPRSLYNQSVSRVFADSFNSCQKYAQRKPQVIQVMFLTHLKRLQTLFALQCKVPTEIETSKSVHRRNNRKLEILKARRKWAVGADLKMLDRLGRDGMSSDESDTDERGTKFGRVLVKPWRATSVGLWLQKLDQPINGERRRGRPPRPRVRSGKINYLSRPVKKLPCNAYHPEWIQGLSNHQQSSLSMDNNVFDFNAN
ncbi:hypothetical protein QCA50_010292 [Cerrena zonata]|uniref:Uncharacterized protein n=1 Tax=Cerrena zonata TaxID=2478898 RepID=A0AAW0G2U2_9APHY